MDFDVSSEVTTLCLSMYVLGFALGPLLLAPLSEFYGRSKVYLGGWFLLFLFNLPIALAPNIGTILVCRFIQGFFGSAPLTNVGGTVSDLWSRNESGLAMAIYGASSTGGPPLALIIAGYVVLEKGWRWLPWVHMAITGGFWLIMLVRFASLNGQRNEPITCRPLFQRRVTVSSWSAKQSMLERS